MTEQRFTASNGDVLDEVKIIAVCWDGVNHNPEAAQAYADWLNAGSPMPRFKVGDRIRVIGTGKLGSILGVTEPHYRLGFDVWDQRDTDADPTSESWLELAPPEPRWKVRQNTAEPAWWYVEDAAHGHQFHNKELADHIAEWLNADPSRSL